MQIRQVASPIDRRTVELMLAVLVLVLVAISFAGVVLPSVQPISIGPGSIPVVPVLLVLCPVLLALVRLTGVVAHGYRIVVTVVGVGSADRTRPGDAAPSRILASIVFGVLAGATLWMIGGTFLFTDVDNDLDRLFVGTISGIVLAVLIVFRSVVYSLFPGETHRTDTNRS